jgi:hypothetical protein
MTEQTFLKKISMNVEFYISDHRMDAKFEMRMTKFWVVL